MVSATRNAPYATLESNLTDWLATGNWP